MTERITRSRSRQPDDISRQTPPAIPRPDPGLVLKPQDSKCKFLNDKDLSRNIDRISHKDRAILVQKQQKLKQPSSQISSFLSDDSGPLSRVAAATLVFAQEAAGTAVCISPQGLLLTCSHCIAEDSSEYKLAQPQWLLFSSGAAVLAKCVAWDPVRDLVLLEIVLASESFQLDGFPYIDIASSPPKRNAHLICIGHPGSEDFEAETPGVRTDYEVLCLSQGRYRGVAKGQDVQDNSEIGALMHDCWTYWGHSGAPLVERLGGRLVGLHSSWDDETGMRRGVALEAIKTFLEKEGVVVTE